MELRQLKCFSCMCQKSLSDTGSRGTVYDTASCQYGDQIPGAGARNAHFLSVKSKGWS